MTRAKVDGLISGLADVFLEEGTSHFVHFINLRVKAHPLERALPVFIESADVRFNQLARASSKAAVQSRVRLVRRDPPRSQSRYAPRDEATERPELS